MLEVKSDNGQQCWQYAYCRGFPNPHGSYEHAFFVAAALSNPAPLKNT